MDRFTKGTIMIHDYLTEPLFHPEQNQYMIDTIQYADGWKPIFEDYLADGTHHVSDNFSDNGVILITTVPRWEPNPPWQPLNGLGDLIMHSYIRRSKWNYHNVQRHRYMWNYYSASSTCLKHQDRPLYPDGTNLDGIQFASAVYYLNTCDAYTEIEGERFPSVEGTFVCFDSMDWHLAVADTNQGARRFTFNIMFEYSHKELK